MNETDDPVQPEGERHRSLEEIASDLGFVETPAMGEIRSQFTEELLREQPEETVRLSVEYRLAGEQLADSSDSEATPFIRLGLELTLAKMWRGHDAKRYSELMNAAYDIAEGHQFYGVIEDMQAMARPDNDHE